MVYLRFSFALSTLVLNLVQGGAPNVRVCPNDEAALLQRSVLSRAERDIQPDEDGPGAAIRAQVRAFGGICGQDASGPCPAECPLTARDLSGGEAEAEDEADDGKRKKFCAFACVPATEAACVAYSPGEPIPDEDLGICRAASLRGCAEFVEPSSTMTLSEMSRCRTCDPGYRLRADGACQSAYQYLWYLLFLAVGTFLAAIVAWLIDLAQRPIINEVGLEHGLATRSRSKLHTPKALRSQGGFTPRGEQGSVSGRTLWPLSTNLCTTMVAGPALTLHFNYMAMVILWSGAITIAWVAFAYCVDDSGEWILLNLGTREAVTPAETCEVVDWGHQMQQKFMWAKAVFVAGCYVWTFVLFILFGVYQRRAFETLDERETTHMDFCAVLEGLHSMPGKDKVEDELCDEIERMTGHRPVGVSVAWEMGDLHQDLMSIIDERFDELCEEQARLKREDAAAGDRESLRASHSRRDTLASRQRRKSSSGRMGKSPSTTPRNNTPRATSLKSPRDAAARENHPLRSFLSSIERAWLTPTTQKLISKGRRRDFEPRHKDSHEVDEDFDVHDALQAMRSCGTAFAVFQSEEARDQAVQKAAKIGGMCFRNTVVSVRQAQNEPDSVIWTNFKDRPFFWRVFRCVLGVLTIFGALVLWTLLFYLPYAYYAMSFNYGQGQWPGMMEETTFVMIIVCGNATMYLLCSEVADRCEFRFVGDRELCYLLLYYFSCLLNVILDMVCAYKIAYMALVGVGSRTHDGILLSDLDDFADRFNAYPMQLELGWTVFAYAFPCTFLLPFLAEPIATIVLPYKIMTIIVGYRPDIQGSRADLFLSCTPMDLSRYADIALNVSLATAVLWFPSGITLSMFGFCLVSSVYIYVYDHWRVLRAVPSFSMSGMRTDCLAQAMLAFPCGLLLSCAFYKANCVQGLERFHPPALASHDIFGHCKEGEMLVLKCAAAFAIHVSVHLAILTFVVPLFGNFEKQPSTSCYSECARRLGHSYFSVNPVHCLRSEWVYEHEPPFIFSRNGKEHLMPQNAEIGAFFSDTSAISEDFSATIETIENLKSMTARREARKYATN